MIKSNPIFCQFIFTVVFWFLLPLNVVAQHQEEVAMAEVSVSYKASTVHISTRSVVSTASYERPYSVQEFQDFGHKDAFAAPWKQEARKLSRYSVTFHGDDTPTYIFEADLSGEIRNKLLAGMLTAEEMQILASKQ